MLHLLIPNRQPQTLSLSLAAALKRSKYVALDLIPSLLRNELLPRDWFLAGVIVSKTLPKATKDNREFSVWRLTNLRNHFVSVYLFGAASSQLASHPVGTVVILLQPKFSKSDVSVLCRCVSFR